MTKPKTYKEEYAKGKRHGYGEGFADGIRYIAQTAERVMEHSNLKQPGWWTSILTLCLKDPERKGKNEQPY